MTFNKLKGIALIINALIPLVSGLAILILLTMLIYDVKGLLHGPIAQLQSHAAALGTEAAKTGDAIQGALASIRSVGDTLAQAQQRIQNIPEQLQIPAIPTPPLDLRIQPSVSVASRLAPGASQYAALNGGSSMQPAMFVTTDFSLRPTPWRSDSQMPTVVRAGLSLPKVNIPTPSIPTPAVPNPIPSVRVEWHNRRVPLPAIPATTIPVPGLRQIKGLLNQNAAILGELNQLMGMVPVLATLHGHVATVVDNLQPWLSAVSLLGAKVLLLIALVACLVVPIGFRIHVVMYSHHLCEQFRTGWALVSHPSTTARTV